MPRVLLLCSINVSCDRLRQVFQSHTEFDIVAGIKDDEDTISKATQIHPDLMIMEMAGDPSDALDTAEKLKCRLPRVPLFLVTLEQSMATEREALHRGIDAVFNCDDDFASLIINARAICGLE